MQPKMATLIFRSTYAYSHAVYVCTYIYAIAWFVFTRIPHSIYMCFWKISYCLGTQVLGTYKTFVKPHASETTIFYTIPSACACKYVRGMVLYTYTIVTLILKGCKEVRVSSKRDTERRIFLVLWVGGHFDFSHCFPNSFVPFLQYERCHVWKILVLLSVWSKIPSDFRQSPALIWWVVVSSVPQ